MNINWLNITKQQAMTTEVEWREVYDQFLPKVYHFFFYKVGDERIAEELAASTFEKAWKSREKYQSKLGEYRFFVFGIAKKVAADYFRKQHPETRLEEADDLPGHQSVEEQVEKRLNFQRLARIVGQLNERERDLVSLKYGAEMTNREIAKFTGLSESNVGTILHRVVLKLRQEWEKSA
jgi:RNA polymerase sigma-70 factor, ECF subfamily